MKILYFGIYDPEFSRNKIYMEGLRQNGAEVIECNDRSKGPLKFLRLWQKHQALKKDYDVIIVGYPSHIVVSLAKLFSPKRVVLDALSSLYEGEVISRRKSKYSFTAMKTWYIDFLAYWAADMILVESNAQIDFFVKTFFVNRKKLVRVFTGASDSVFFPDPTIQKREVFTVVFRGQFLPEAGMDTILEAAKILQEKDIRFLFLGKDFGKEKLADKILALGLKNTELTSGFLPFEKIRNLMLSCHVSLGQFAHHSRLDRTIPHKAYETLAMGLPYVTGRAGGVSELLQDGQTCLMVHLADPQDLADKILELKNNPDLMKKIGDGGYDLYKEKLSPKVLGREIIDLIF